MRYESRYTTVAVVLHWLVAALVIAQFALGWIMQEIPKNPAGPRAATFNFHKSMGLLILAIMLVRLAWRLGHRPPALPSMPRWQVGLAHGTHALLYVLLLGMAVTGYLGSAYSGFPVKFFGVTLPSWAAKNAAMKDLMGTAHLALGWTLAFAFALHIAGVVKHTFMDHDGLLRRMSLRR